MTPKGPGATHKGLTSTCATTVPQRASTHACHNVTAVGYSRLYRLLTACLTASLLLAAVVHCTNVGTDLQRWQEFLLYLLGYYLAVMVLRYWLLQLHLFLGTMIICIASILVGLNLFSNLLTTITSRLLQNKTRKYLVFLQSWTCYSHF